MQTTSGRDRRHTTRTARLAPWLCIALLFTGPALAAPPGGGPPGGGGGDDFPIEAAYEVPGTWDVSSASVTDGGGAVIYELLFPTELGAGGFVHPIITWGNGTNADPGQYPGLLEQLASWGFVVVASTSPTTGTGVEMLAGVDFLIGENANPASIFHQKLDAGSVGAIGHSQGAGGTVNATNLADGAIATAVPIALPDQMWVGPGDEFSVADLDVPVFFVGASRDRLIAPPSTLQGYYDEVPGAAALAVLKKAGHNTIQGSGGDFLGYLTAWMMYQLQGDQTARDAFVGSPPEIDLNGAWQNQEQKNLP